MSPMALQRASMVLAPMRLRWALSLAKAISIGLRSGLWRQEEEPSSTLLQGSLGFCALVAGEAVQDHHVARLQRWGELGLDVGVEDLTVHGLVDHPRRGQAVAA